MDSISASPTIAATWSGNDAAITRRPSSAGTPVTCLASDTWRFRSVRVRTRYMTASTSPQARLQPSAAIKAVRTSCCPAVATDTAPTMLTAMSRPNITSETRSMGSRRPRPTNVASFTSVLLRQVLVRVVRLAVLPGFLPLGQLDLFARLFLVGDVRQKVADDVEPRAPLVVRLRDEPGCEARVGGGEHVVASAGVV